LGKISGHITYFPMHHKLILF